ncbi:MAG: glycosyltransferase [Treponema sp.]|nr:glycosyltransferase [Treponema sp.]
MNIALFSDSYLPTKSGIVTVVIQLREILQQMGHHVVIVTVSNTDPSYKEEPDSCVLSVESVPSPVGDNQYVGRPDTDEVLAFLKKNNVEIIHSHTEFFMGACAIKCGKILNIPVIASTHTMWEDYYRYYFSFGRFVPRWFVRKIVKAVYRKFYAFINVSEKARNYFLQPFMLPKTPSTVIPNATDTKKFVDLNITEDDKNALRESLHISRDDTVVLYVGRVVEEKRVEELLQVMKRVVKGRDNIKMLFVGSGAMEARLKKETAEAGLQDKIIFAGFIDWFKLSRYYAISHIFVTTSLSEMHSMTVLEAMVMHLPIVCRRDTSFTDTIFPGENGYMVDTDEEMDEKIYELSDDRKKCHEMGEKSYALSKNFLLDVHGKKTVAFYREVLKHYPKPVTPDELAAAVQNYASLGV